MEQVKRKFKGSYQNLLDLATLLLVNAQNAAADLNKHFVGIFVESFFIEKRAMLAMAATLPGVGKRIQDRVIAHNELADARKSTNFKANFLEQYLQLAFKNKSSDLEAYLKYITDLRATNPENWDGLRAFFRDVVPVLTANKTVLEAAGMPSGFVQEVSDLGERVNNLFRQYSEANNAASQSTGEVIKVLNDIYDWVMFVCACGQSVYAETPEKAQYFVYNRLLEQVAGGGPMGISGVITNFISKRPVEAVTVEILYFDQVIKTDKKGRYKFLKLAEGVYKLRCTHPDYEPLLIENVVVKPNVVSRLNIVLKPLVPPTVEVIA